MHGVGTWCLRRILVIVSHCRLMSSKRNFGNAMVIILRVTFGGIDIWLVFFIDVSHVPTMMPTSMVMVI